MSVDLCEHDLPLRACEICRDAADLLGKGDNVLISRAYLTEWVREANKYQAAGKKLEALEKENAALRQALRAIANPIAAMQKAVPKGHTFSGAMAVQIAADPAYYQGIAQDALDEIERSRKRKPPLHRRENDLSIMR